MDINTVGKPALTQEQIDDIFRKLEPRLRTGLSINKACIDAGIAKSTVYDLLKENEQFAERVEAAKNYHSVIVTDIITKELELASKMAGSSLLTGDQMKLVQWVALHSISTRDEFKDPKIEIKAEPALESNDKLNVWFNNLIKEANDNAQTENTQQENLRPETANLTNEQTIKDTRAVGGLSAPL